MRPAQPALRIGTYLVIHVALLAGVFAVLSALASPRAEAFVALARERAMAPADETDACLRCHGNQAAVANPAAPGDPLAPLLPESFSMRWLMHEFQSESMPPFESIPKPSAALRGITHYDWESRRMTEVYLDRCIDIFPGSRDYSCQFLSEREKTYFIRFDLGRLDLPTSCCLWSEGEFWAPRPDVLRNMKFQKELRVGGVDADFWMLDIPMPGPFGYGTSKLDATPVAFWFPVIGGWVQQEFQDFAAGKPPEGAFALPELCGAQPPVCSF